MSTKSWDVKLGGRPWTYAYARGLQLGSASIEPVQQAEVGSVVIASFHEGIGRGVNDGVLRYSAARSANLTVPGEFLPGYADQEGDPDRILETPNPAAVVAHPAFAYATGAIDQVFVVAGQEAWYFDPLDPEATWDAMTLTVDGNPVDEMNPWPTNAEFSGASFQYNDELVFGVINNNDPDTGKPAAYAVIDLSDPTSIDVRTDYKISYGASARARCFWIEDVGGNEGGLKWAPTVAGATFKGSSPYIEKTAIDTPGIDMGLPRTSWLAMVGQSLLVFRRDGALIGADETGLLSIAGSVPVAGDDFDFGRKATPYHDGIMFGSAQGLWSFDMRSLTLRPASPNYIQGQSEERLRGDITALTATGPYLFFAQHQVADSVDTGSIFQMVRYAGSVAIHDCLHDSDVVGAEDKLVRDMLAYYDQTARITKLFYLVYAQGGDVELRWLPVRLPNDQSVDDSKLASSSEVDLPQLAGLMSNLYLRASANALTKLWVQVRGHFEKGASGDASLEFSNFEVDGQSVSIASVTETGPFVRTITATNDSARLGRELTQGTIALVDPVHDTSLPLPLTFDFIWVPAHEDALVLKVIVSGEVSGNTPAVWARSPFEAREFLIGLVNTVTTVEFPTMDNQTNLPHSWSVFVTDVTLDNSEPPDGGNLQEALVATVKLRRLS